MRRIVIVAVLVLAGCGGNAMADEAQYVIDQQPDDVEDTCGGLAKEADSVDDLVAELEAMDGDRRATIMDNFDSRAGDELPPEAGEWSWAQVLDFYRAMWAKCDELGELG